MRARRLLAAGLLLGLAAATATADDSSAPPRFTVGVMASIAADVDARDFEAAMRIWIRELAVSEGYRGESLVYQELRPLVEDFAQGRLDLAALKSLDYLQVAATLDAEIAFAAVRGGKPTRSYLLMVRADERPDALAGLKGKRLVIVAGEEPGLLFVETLLFRARLGAVEQFFGAIERRPKTSQAVLAVFFKQADACLVSDAGLQVMVEQNPQVGRRLVSVATSPELVSGLTIFRRSYDPVHTATVRRASHTIGETARGRQVLMLLKVDGFRAIREDDLDSLRRLVEEHGQLQGRRPGR